MANRRKAPITLPAVFDTGSAKLTIAEDGTYGRVYVREADGAAFTPRTTDKHVNRTGSLQTLPPPIDEAKQRGRIDERQHAAADRYRQDYAEAFGPALHGASFERSTDATFSGHVPDGQVIALRAWRMATLFVREHTSGALVDLLTLVVIDELPAARAAVKLGLPKRNGIVMVRRALDLLAAHYRMA